MTRAVTVKLRLRVPEGKRMKSVMVNGKNWDRFDAAEESVTIPPEMSGKVEVEARY